jgi:hypothetical protein
LTSSSAGVVWQNWSLYAYPRDATVGRIFRGALLTAVQDTRMSGDFVLSVISNNVDQRISANVKGATVADLRWYVVAQ